MTIMFNKIINQYGSVKNLIDTYKKVTGGFCPIGVQKHLAFSEADAELISKLYWAIQNNKPIDYWQDYFYMLAEKPDDIPETVTSDADSGVAERWYAHGKPLSISDITKEMILEAINAEMDELCMEDMTQYEYAQEVTNIRVVGGTLCCDYFSYNLDEERHYEFISLTSLEAYQYKTVYLLYKNNDVLEAKPVSDMDKHFTLTINSDELPEEVVDLVWERCEENFWYGDGIDLDEGFEWILDLLAEDLSDYLKSKVIDFVGRLLKQADKFKHLNIELRTDSHILMHIPHASTNIPRGWKQNFRLSGEQLKTEAMTMADLYTDEIFNVEGVSKLETNFSRILCDVERFENDKDEPMSKVGMGAVYQKTSKNTKLRKELGDRSDVIYTFYKPHHIALALITATLKLIHGKVVIIDCHSFPSQARWYEPAFESNQSMPNICIGTDEFHTPNELAQFWLSIFEESYFVGKNYPFAGSIVPIESYKQDGNVHSIMIEINRSLYMDESIFEKDQISIDQLNRTIQAGINSLLEK